MKKTLLLVIFTLILSVGAKADYGAAYTMQSTSSMMSSMGSSPLSNGGYTDYGQPYGIGATSPMFTDGNDSGSSMLDDDDDDPDPWDDPRQPIGNVWSLLIFGILYGAFLVLQRHHQRSSYRTQNSTIL
ncbi:MAG: hypothetical protein MJZ92_01770 [Paludibacteraceae bacterium]|nr:hypothetical protein [Paludibacteraceae bacterium]